MDVRESYVAPCGAHTHFHKGCQACLVETVLKVCDHLVDQKEVKTNSSLVDVFEGTHIVHVDENSIVNVVALPVTDEDLANQTIRYTIEIRKKA